MKSGDALLRGSLYLLLVMLFIAVGSTGSGQSVGHAAVGSLSKSVTSSSKGSPPPSIRPIRSVRPVATIRPAGNQTMKPIHVIRSTQSVPTVKSGTMSRRIQPVKRPTIPPVIRATIKPSAKPTPKADLVMQIVEKVLSKMATPVVIQSTPRSRPTIQPVAKPAKTKPSSTPAPSKRPVSICPEYPAALQQLASLNDVGCKKIFDADKSTCQLISVFDWGIVCEPDGPNGGIIPSPSGGVQPPSSTPMPIISTSVP